MPELWRLTRNRYGRAIYDALARIGITATVMYEYQAALDGTRDPSATGDRSFSIEQCEPAEVAPLDAPTYELCGDEVVLGAVGEDGPLGYLFLSIDATHEIHPLERTMTFDGAYVRRVFVDPAHRGEGVASAMLDAACRLANDRGAETATALVALDNRPSRWLFEGRGFSPARAHRYVRVGPIARRSVRSA